MVISTFRPEYGSDLHWLLGWGERLKLHLQSQEPSDCSNLTFRPDSHALTAMSNFSVKYAYNIETIDRFLKQTEQMYWAFLKQHDDETVFGLATAMTELQTRIFDAVNAIRVDQESIDEIASPIPVKTNKDIHSKQRWEALAMILVQAEPGRSDASIAREIRKHKSTLSRSKLYQRAAGLARGARESRPRGYIKIDPNTGLNGIEAHGDE